MRSPIPEVLPERLNPEQRLKLPVVQALTGLSRTKIYDDMKLGRFPIPERNGSRCSRWRAGDVLDHLEAQARR